MPVKVRDVLRRLRDEGWRLDRQSGTSHRVFKHDDLPGRLVVVAGDLNDDIKPGTWNSIQKNAGWK